MPRKASKSKRFSGERSRRKSKRSVRSKTRGRVHSRYRASDPNQSSINTLVAEMDNLHMNAPPPESPPNPANVNPQSSFSSDEELHVNVDGIGPQPSRPRPSAPPPGAEPSATTQGVGVVQPATMPQETKRRAKVSQKTKSLMTRFKLKSPIRKTTKKKTTKKRK